MVHAIVQTYGDIHRIDCTGHATGSEQVCAAVSGIVSALANYQDKRQTSSHVLISVKQATT